MKSKFIELLVEFLLFGVVEAKALPRIHIEIVFVRMFSIIRLLFNRRRVCFISVFLSCFFFIFSADGNRSVDKTNVANIRKIFKSNRL